MTTSRGTALRRLMPAAAVLLMVGCVTQQEQVAPDAKPSASAPSATQTVEKVDLARLESILIDQAKGSDSAPTGAGLTAARQAGNYVSYVWETTKGKVCFAQIAVSGAGHETACAVVTQATPEKGSKLEALFGPGMGFSESYIVFAADPGSKVTSVRYEGKETLWKLVRRLSPQTTGRDVYYVTLPDGHKGWLDVTLEQADGQRKPDRLQVSLWPSQ